MAATIICALISFAIVPQVAAGTFALSFDGSNDRVTFGPAPGLGLGTFTIETWFKRQGAGVGASTGSGGVTAIPLITKGRGEADGDSRDMNYFLGIRTSDGVLVADFEEGAGGSTPGLNHPVAGVTPIANGVWYHAAATYDGTTWRLYLNGAQQSQFTVGQPPRADSIQHAALAAALDSAGTAAGFFNGVLDEVRIWNYARSAAQISANYSLELLSAPGLVGRWGLEEGSSTVAYDTSGFAHDGTLVNGPVWVSGYPFGAPPQPNVTRQPYLQMVTPTSLLVRWRTDLASNSRVRYGLNATNLNQSAANATSLTEHQITLTGLTPNTRYYYAVGTSTADLAGGSDYFFYTAPAPGPSQPMRFWVLGDAGTGTAAQQNVRNAYYNFTGTRYTDLLLMLGDNVYNSGTDAEFQTKMFDIYPTLLRKTAVLPTIGNHDTAGSSDPDINTLPYFLIFTLPTAGQMGGVASGTEKYYSFNYGNVHFVCLDSMTSNRSTNGPMFTWLQDDLAQNTADWLIAYWHHPPYSKGSHNSDTDLILTAMRQNALPILEAYGVDMVLSGHSHSYERSYLLDQHYGVSSNLTAGMVLDSGSGRENTASGAYQKIQTGPGAHEGAVYVVPGSAGQISGGTLNHPAMFVSLNQLGSFVLDFDGQRLDAKFITDTGLTNDYFTLLKGPATNNPPAVSITSPADGTDFTAPANITIAATALDSDGSVASVAFYVGATLLGTDPGAPFSFAWNNVSTGTYTLTAVATDNQGASGPSTPITISVNPPPPPAAPTAPTALSARALRNRKIRLAWSDNSSNEAGFKIEHSTNGTTWAQIATVAANSTGFTETGLTAGVTYSYRVRAYNSAGDSAYSNTATATAR